MSTTQFTMWCTFESGTLNCTELQIGGRFHQGNSFNICGLDFAVTCSYYDNKLCIKLCMPPSISLFSYCSGTRDLTIKTQTILNWIEPSIPTPTSGSGIWDCDHWDGCCIFVESNDRIISNWLKCQAAQSGRYQDESPPKKVAFEIGQRLIAFNHWTKKWNNVIVKHVKPGKVKFTWIYMDSNWDQWIPEKNFDYYKIREPNNSVNLKAKIDIKLFIENKNENGRDIVHEYHDIHPDRYGIFQYIMKGFIRSSFNKSLGNDILRIISSYFDNIIIGKWFKKIHQTIPIYVIFHDGITKVFNKQANVIHHECLIPVPVHTEKHLSIKQLIMNCLRDYNMDTALVDKYQLLRVWKNDKYLSVIEKRKRVEDCLVPNETYYIWKLERLKKKLVNLCKCKAHLYL
eukprot:275614_1